MKNTSNSSVFPTVGDNVLSYVGGGAAHPNPKYTTMVKKGTMGRGSSPTGTMASRSNTKLSEKNGPSCTVKATLYKANAAEASATERNVYTVPSAAGVKDFFSEKARQGQLM